MTSGITRSKGERVLVDVLFSLILAGLIVVLLLWVTTRFLQIPALSPHLLWRTFAGILVVGWLVSIVRLALMIKRRTRLADRLLRERTELINANLSPGADYLAGVETVLAASPLKQISVQILGLSLVSVVFMGFVNAQPLDGWVRTILVIAIVSLLFVPGLYVGHLIETAVNRSNNKLLNDI